MATQMEEEAQMTSTEVMPRARYARSVMFVQYWPQTNWVCRPIYCIESVRDVYKVSIVSHLGLAAEILHRIGWTSVKPL